MQAAFIRAQGDRGLEPFQRRVIAARQGLLHHGHPQRRKGLEHGLQHVECEALIGVYDDLDIRARLAHRHDPLYRIHAVELDLDELEIPSACGLCGHEIGLLLNAQRVRRPARLRADVRHVPDRLTGALGL